MDGRGHASIDMEKLADSLRGKLNTLPYPSSEECCIYRVPQPRRSLHPSDYTPQMVSIGPLHHGKEEFKAMEENKLRYLRYFLQRTKVSMSDFLAFIKEKEVKLRNCYAETIHFESDEFVTMILVDAVFLIELFMRHYDPNLRTVDDPLFRKSGSSFLGIQMRYDLYLAENQLPLFIFSELFDLAKTATYNDIYQEISFFAITDSWFSIDSLFPTDHQKIKIYISKAQHFVDLFLLCLQPSQLHAPSYSKYQNIPCVKELHQAGVKFESGSSKNLVDIKFNNGVLEIPCFDVYDSTRCLYRNLLFFENMHDHPLYFNDYVIIISHLVDTSKDADLLIQNGIVLGDSEKLSTVFHSLFKDCVKGGYLQYADLIEDIQAYRQSSWNMWKANLKQNYFNTPWASISVIAAVILLLLTVTQTVCALIAL